MSASTVYRAVIYARKSTTDAKNPGKSIADQVREAMAEAARRGWEVAAVHQDDGISASRHARGKRRPGFEAVLDLIGTGEVHAVLMAEQSRATRSLSVLGSLLETCAETGTLLLVGGTEVDPSKPEGFLMAGVTGAVDAAESERIRRRIKRGLDGSAVAGRPPGRNVYGYTRVYDQETKALVSVRLNDDAPVVVGIIDAIMAGSSLRSIAVDLNRRGVPAPCGGEWHPSNIKRMARNPVYAGLRVHRGEVVGRGIWPALISEDRHSAVLARLASGERSKTRPGRLAHMLSGLAVCGPCGAVLRPLGSTPPKYACPKCYRVAINKADLEAYVEEAVLALVDTPRLKEILQASIGAGGAEAADRIQALEAKRREIGVAIAEGLDIVAATSALEAIAAKLEEARADLAKMSADPLAAELASEPDIRGRWVGMSVEQRRAAVGLFVVPVVHPSQRPRGSSRGFEPERVELRWRLEKA